MAAPPGPSGRGPLSRAEYAHGKKAPQIAWVVARLAAWGRPVGRVLDVGGGRGDLAVAIARRFPGAAVTSVDRTAASVAAGEAARDARGLSNLRFVVADLAAPDDVAALECDVVVALHACGGLTDLALAVARSKGAACLVVPCCFRSHPHLRAKGDPVLDALCETNRRDVALRAMRCVNSRRCLQFADAKLLAMDAAWTPRNLVIECGGGNKL